MINESVILTARNYGCLTEMFVEGKRNLKDGAFILAYRSKIWVFGDRKSFEESSKRMTDSIKKEAQIKKQQYGSMINHINENRPDMLQAVYRKHGDTAVLEIVPGFEMQQQMETSPLVKKVAQTLGCSMVTYNHRETGDILQDADVEDLNPSDPKWGFHGTSSGNLLGILKNGIGPRPDRGNYSDVDVVHYDHIFLTMDINKAIHHAYHSCLKTESNRQSRGYGNKKSYKTDDYGNLLYQPIVIRTNIPDPSLITADYDVDRESGQDTYAGMYKKNERMASDKGKMPGSGVKISKSIGVFGYKGKILPQQFTEIQIGPKVDVNSGSDLTHNDFHIFNADYIAKWLKKLYEVYDNDTYMINNLDLQSYFGQPREFIDEIEQQREENAE